MPQAPGDDRHVPSPVAPDPHQLRISDADRHQVAELLRNAAGEGRIDLDELDERLEAAFKAKTYAEIVPLTSDLPTGAALQPAPQQMSRPPVVTGASHDTSVAVMSSTVRRGPWQVGHHHIAAAMMGNVTIDLREAVFTSAEVVVQATAVMGSVEVIVNPETVVVCEGFGFMGDFSESRSRTPAQTTAASRVVRVKGLALMGSVNIKRKPVSGQSNLRLGKGH